MKTIFLTLYFLALSPLTNAEKFVFKDITTSDANTFTSNYLFFINLKVELKALKERQAIYLKKINSKSDIEINQYQLATELNKCIPILASEMLIHLNKKIPFDAKIIEKINNSKNIAIAETNTKFCSENTSKVYDLYSTYVEQLVIIDEIQKIDNSTFPEVDNSHDHR